jgi:reverse gyrase
MGQKKTLKRKAAKKPSPRQRPTNAELRQQLAASLQREDATASENLRESCSKVRTIVLKRFSSSQQRRKFCR